MEVEEFGEDEVHQQFKVIRFVILGAAIVVVLGLAVWSTGIL